MTKKISVLKDEAIAALTGHWMNAALATLVFFIIFGGISVAGQPDVSVSTSGMPMYHFGPMFYVGNLITLLLLPIAYGYLILFLNLKRGAQKVEIGQMFDGFKDYGRILGTLLLTYLYTVLWTLLLIVPGIIKGLSYSMTTYILKDEPDLKFNAAIEKSMAMMKGHKMRLFLLQLSFIGWILLSMLTLGIGLFFLYPYMVTTLAAFYEDLKAQQQ